MKKNNNVRIFSPIIQEAYDNISELDWATDALTDGIANRIDSVMKDKGISKKELAALTHRHPSDVTRWLGGGHNFTCRTIALIEQALGVSIIQIVQ
ncbi:MAG: helix-turn-helix transcriptional regulator [Bacteroidales bacterium]|nr:helix-turn-helix transcriptional regulator [Bacteroidales bacterium]